MQLLEDKDIVNSGDLADRIANLRKKVQELLEKQALSDTSGVSSKYNEELIEENLMLKKQLEKKPEGVDSTEHNKLVEENLKLKQQILEKADNGAADEILKKVEAENKSLKLEIENLSNQENVSNNDEIEQENIMLKNKLVDREKTIKELDFKLEMFKLAKSLREGAGINSKSEELKSIINEYIKEIDKSITSLNIE